MHLVTALTLRSRNKIDSRTDCADWLIRLCLAGLEEGLWDVSAGNVHRQFAQESLAGIQSGSMAAMSMARKHQSLIQSHVSYGELETRPAR